MYLCMAFVVWMDKQWKTRSMIWVLTALWIFFQMKLYIYLCIAFVIWIGNAMKITAFFSEIHKVDFLCMPSFLYNLFLEHSRIKIGVIEIEYDKQLHYIM